MPTIFIGADHGGYKIKKQVKLWLNQKLIPFNDLGADSEDSCDYPIFAQKVGRAVVENQGKGILICRSGQGMSIAANKIKGIRACLAWNPEVAIKSREHNDANVLCLPADYISNDDSVSIVKAWLSTPFSDEIRHIKRIRMLDEIN